MVPWAAGQLKLELLRAQTFKELFRPTEATVISVAGITATMAQAVEAVAAQ
jgi:hypothetical protein